MDPSKYIADHDAPQSMLSLKNDFFPLLTPEEQQYAHFMSKASHAGTRVVLRQVSDESEAIYDLVLFIHKRLEGVYPKDQIQLPLYMDYVSQFLSNLGNYKSFGDSKFIPGCTKEYFLSLCTAADLVLDESIYEISNTMYQGTTEQLIDDIYELDEARSLLGFPAEGHVSSYYIGLPISRGDMKLLKDHLFSKHNIMPENTRIVKIAPTRFEIWVASEDLANGVHQENYPMTDFHLEDPHHTRVTFNFGDHSREMEMIADYLKQAGQHAANDTQREMLKEYVRHFYTGSGPAHKEAQKLWVKDIAPSVETNIGFIETYREPSGIIGEFEGLVSIQNKERTAKFSTMVNNAKEFIDLLPWDASFEKDQFNPPDFTSLEVLTFTGSGIPAGINIPNYDDVRLNVGFKNVSLGNILSAATKSSSKHAPSFIKQEDLAVFQKCQADSFEVQVGIHELLGHGSGKLLMESGPNEYNFDIANPPIDLNGNPVKTFYKQGETWGSVFGSLAGAFEETRAEVVAMYLITNRKLLDIFGFKTKEDQDNIIYAGFLQMARAGLMALEFWDPKTGKWGQPHMQARYSIMKTFLSHCSDEKFLTINKVDSDNLEISLDRSLIETAGHDCVKDYLQHLHVYKCSADFENGSKYYIDRSTVTPELAELRDIVISKRLPRRQYIQANTIISDDGSVVLKEYEETPLGMIQSFVDRET